MIALLGGRPARREYALLFALALTVGVLVAGGLSQPGYTDAYYYYNAAERLVAGLGLTDPYVALTYIGAPADLPAPSHLYWMPLTSFVAAVGMWTTTSLRLGSALFDAAQGPFVLLWAALALVGFWCGARLGGSRRHAWLAGLLIIASPFFAPFWTTTDTFTLFGLCGVLALISIGLGRARRSLRWFALGGVMAGLAHLTRADGMLLAIVLALAALWPDGGSGWRARLRWAGVGLFAYTLVLTPWLLRNLAVGAPPLPAGGMATIWLRGYDEIVNYPPGELTFTRFLDWGLANIIASRWEAVTVNAQHFVAEQGLLVVWPFMFVGLWKRRRDPFLSGVWLYALGLHGAMTFVFAYPGMRGGLFHSSSALLPFWFSLGVLGIDDAVGWVADRRRHWHAPQARVFFSAALVIVMAALTVLMLTSRLPGWGSEWERYAALGDLLPDDAVVMVNSPAAFYYHTRLPGVVVPNGGVETVRMLCEQYGVTHVVLDVNRTQPLADLFLGRETAAFLTEIAHLGAGNAEMRVFEVAHPDGQDLP